MRRLPILCLLLVIAVYANAVSLSNEAEDDDFSEENDSLESFEDGTLNAVISNNWNKWKTWKPYDHSKTTEKNLNRSKVTKKPNDHSKEKKEHDHSEENNSQEAKNKPTISDEVTLLPHEKFCKYFYVFDAYEASIVSCSRGERFDAEKLRCLKTKEVNCGKRKKHPDSSEEKKARINFKCPKWSGLHPHEYYCNLYYSCQNKKGRLYMCPPGMLFDDNNKKCVDRGSVNCNKRIDPNEDDEEEPEDKIIDPNPNFTCRENFGRYNHEQYCNWYYQCNNRRPSVRGCRKGWRYHSNRRRCRESDEVTCDGKPDHKEDDEEEPEDKIIDPNPNFTCRENFGRYNHEKYCNWYYQCNDRRPSVRGCRKGWRYHSNRRRCRESHEVTCDGKPDHKDGDEQPTTVTPEVFVCPSKSGKYPHERDCSAFYKCDSWRYKLQHCPKGKLYNERKKTCESENKVTCGNRIHPDQDPEDPEDKVIDPNPNFNCRENFGRYNHDQYCNWYYQCHDRRPSVRECRRGWRYNSHRRRCRESHEVTCDGKPDHEDTTTEEITTTPTPTEPEITTTTEPETTTTSTEPEPTTPSPTEPEPTTPSPTEPEPTTPSPTEPETATPTPTEPETTTPTTTEEPTKPPKVTAPDTDCDEDDADCIINDLGITPDWFKCPEDIGSYPHPSSRKLFIFCLNWKPSVKKCGQDLLYSEDLRTCVHP